MTSVLRTRGGGEINEGETDNLMGGRGRGRQSETSGREGGRGGARNWVNKGRMEKGSWGEGRNTGKLLWNQAGYFRGKKQAKFRKYSAFVVNICPNSSWASNPQKKLYETRCNSGPNFSPCIQRFLVNWLNYLSGVQNTDQLLQNTSNRILRACDT